jgi:hypothetical protein
VIASTPVARWNWGQHECPFGDPIEAVLRGYVDCFGVLVALGVVAPHGAPVRIVVRRPGDNRAPLFKGVVPLGPRQADAEWDEVAMLAAEIRGCSVAEGTGTVDVEVYANLPGAGEADGRLFRLGLSVARGRMGVQLETFSDVWMPYDLKGRPQPAVHAANRPRLGAVLRGFSELLRSETDPAAPTWFARPTGTGADNLFEADGTASDVWDRWEAPQRVV